MPCPWEEQGAQRSPSSQVQPTLEFGKEVLGAGVALVPECSWGL